MLVNQSMLSAFQVQSRSPFETSAEFPRVEGGMPEFGEGLLDGMQSGVDPTTGKSFAYLLTEAIDGVSNQDQRAVQLGLDYVLGKPGIDAHQVMIEQAKAESQLHLMSAVTNKLASGYQTLMNMQI